MVIKSLYKLILMLNFSSPETLPILFATPDGTVAFQPQYGEYSS